VIGGVVAKRFTDTDKWKKTWFRELSPKMKCAWEYLRDMCDHAGVWDADFALMKFFIGEEITREELEKAFHNRILKLQDGKKYLLLGYIKFQYVTLKPGNRTHESVKTILKAVAPEIDPESLSEYPNPYRTLCIPYDNPSLTPSEISETLSEIFKGDKGTGTDKGSGTGSETEPYVKGFRKPTFRLGAV
jgi:hypothetical protein